MIDMNFPQAFNLLRSGLAVRRQSWEEGTYVYDKNVTGMAPFIAIRESTGTVSPWSPAMGDLYATDWQEAKK